MSSKKIQSGDLNLGDRIKKMRKAANLTQDQLAQLIDITQNTVNRYEKGHRFPDSDILTRMVNVFKCAPGWLLTGEGSMEKQPAVSEDICSNNNEEFVSVPQVSGEISAGRGLVPDNNIEMRIAFRREWIERRGDPSNMSLIRVTGDSMEPTLQSGDLVLVDHSRNQADPQGGIYALTLDGSIMLKRVQINYASKTLKVISDNERYDSFEAAPDQVNINGKIIWFGREIER